MVPRSLSRSSIPSVRPTRSTLLHLPYELLQSTSSKSASRFPPSPSRPVVSRSAWTSAFQSLPSLPFSLPTSTSSSIRTAGSTIRIADPLKVLGAELGHLRNNVQHLLGSGHPALDTIAKYYFQAEGKHIRPTIVLLMSQATNGLAPGWQALVDEAHALERARASNTPPPSHDINEPLSPNEILNDANPGMTTLKESLIAAFQSATASSPSPATTIDRFALLPTQRRLAEITEMIHVASLLHDDVIDAAATRRGAPSAPSLFGNKMSVLAGDFLLARASLHLARLGDDEVMELVASVLANLVEGEVMQMKGNVPVAVSSTNGPSKEIFEHYMKKTYLKTASLIGKSTRATTVLGGCGRKQGWVDGDKVKDIAYAYGRNVGIAFQLVDDLLDFTASAAELGKPGQGADLKLGLATAPALYAWEEFPELGAMIERKFAHEDDVERARYLISKSSGTERTAALAAEHSKAARLALEGLPESEARDALDKIASDTLTRKK